MKVAQITTESREKEVMLAALKQQLDSEHERLVSKVKLSWTSVVSSHLKWTLQH